MEPTPPPVRSDPEFRPALSERSLPRDADPGAYRRILANPFLGLLALGLWIIAARAALTGSADAPGLLLIESAALAVAAYLLPRLFHYHCLDCGATGRLTGWRRHVCPPVARRLVEGRPRRFRGPTPMFQALLWLYVLALALVLGSLLTPASR